MFNIIFTSEIEKWKKAGEEEECGGVECGSPNHHQQT